MSDKTQKRTRGRPRKYPLKGRTPPTPKVQETEPPKRKRGRPRKYTSVTNENQVQREEVTVTLPKRGRPRKETPILRSDRSPQNRAIVARKVTNHDSNMLADVEYQLLKKVVFHPHPDDFSREVANYEPVDSIMTILEYFRKFLREDIVKFQKKKEITGNFMVSAKLFSSVRKEGQNNLEYYKTYVFDVDPLIFTKNASPDTIVNQIFCYYLSLFERKFAIADDESMRFVRNNMRQSTRDVMRKDKNMKEDGYFHTIKELSPLKMELSLAPHIDKVGQGYIPLPKSLEGKKCFINPKNDDYYCIFYTIIASEISDNLKSQKSKEEPQTILRKYCEKYNIDIPKIIRGDESFNKVREKAFRHLLKEKYDYWMKKLEMIGGIYIQDLDKLCRHLNKNIRVYSYDSSYFYPTYIYESHKKADISLLLLSKKANQNNEILTTKCHFVLITNIRTAFTPDGNTAYRTEFCDICLRFYSVKNANDTEARENHEKLNCLANPTTGIIMPSPSKKVKFTKFEAKIMKDFVVFFDFESRQIIEIINDEFRIVQVPTTVAAFLHCITDPSKSLPYFYFSHNDPKVLIKTLMKKLYEYYDYVQSQYIYKEVDVSKMTEEEIYIFNNYTQIESFINEENKTEYRYKVPVQYCHFCKEEISRQGTIRKGQKIVRDHCHLTGKFRGFAHHECNSKDKHQKLLDIFSFNGMKYDLKLILQEVDFDELKVTRYRKTREVIAEIKEDFHLSKEEEKKLRQEIKVRRLDSEILTFNDKDYNLTYESTDVRCIQQGGGNFLRFQVRNLVFRDAIKMYNVHNSLSDLIDRLYNKGEGYKKFKSTIDFIMKDYPHLSPEEVEYLATSKGHYPYLYFDSYRKLLSTNIPTINDFKNLYDELPSQEYYNEFLKCWNLLRCKTFGDYTKFYNILDTQQLADILTDYRLEFYKSYEMDPIHFITVPAASWQAMLKLSKVELDLVTDSSIYNIIKSGIRGGNTRVYYNNYDYFEEKEKETKHSTECWPLDVNGMYSAIMLQHLPTRKIRYSNDSLDKVLETPIDAEKGYYVVIDFAIKEKYHNYLENYVPIFKRDSPPDSVKVKLLKKKKNIDNIKKYLSSEEIDLANQKLIQTLEPQKDYPIHYHLLKQIMEIKNDDGEYILTKDDIKVKHIIEFEQKPFIKDFIELNTKLRQEAKRLGLSSEELYKLIMNAIFGKSMQAVEKYQSTVFCRLIEECIAHFTDPFYKIHRLINDQLIAVSKLRRNTEADQPIIVGASILDKSKTIMIKYWYNILKPIFKDKIKMHYTDTDSMYIVVESERGFWYELEEANMLHHFDISTLDKEYYKDLVERNQDILKNNQKAPGLLAPDTALPLASLKCLAAKSYTYRKFKLEDGKLVPEEVQKNKGKGVDKKILEKFTEEDYNRVLTTGEMKKVKINRMIDKDRKLAWYNMEKIALNAVDNKGYVQLEPNQLILPWGHKDIPKLRQKEIDKVTKLYNNSEIKENIINDALLVNSI